MVKYAVHYGTNTLDDKLLTLESEEFDTYEEAKAWLVKLLVGWQIDFWMHIAPNVEDERAAWDEMINTHYYHFFEYTDKVEVELGLSEDELLYWHWVDYDSAGFARGDK